MLIFGLTFMSMGAREERRVGTVDPNWFARVWPLSASWKFNLHANEAQLQLWVMRVPLLF